MTENIDKNQPKEVDLLELFKHIGKGIKSLFVSILKAFVYLISFGIKQIKWLIAITLVGILLGFAYYNLSKPVFSSGMVLEANGVSTVDIIEYMNDLSNACKSNKEVFAQILGINDSIAQSVKKVKSYPYIDVNMDGKRDFVDFDEIFDPTDTTMAIIEGRCYVHIELHEQQPNNILQKEIVNYINNNEYLGQLNNIYRNNLTEQIEQTELEVQKLDSLQNIEYFDKESAQPIPVSNGGYLVYTEKDKKMYYANKLELLREKQSLERSLELSNEPVTVVKGMSDLAVQEASLLVLMVKFGFWFGLVGFVIILVYVNRNLLLESN